MSNLHKIGDLLMATQFGACDGIFLSNTYVYGVIIDADFHKYRIHWMDGSGGDSEWHPNGQIETWKALLNEKLRD